MAREDSYSRYFGTPPEDLYARDRFCEVNDLAFWSRPFSEIQRSFLSGIWASRLCHQIKYNKSVWFTDIITWKPNIKGLFQFVACGGLGIRDSLIIDYANSALSCGDPELERYAFYSILGTRMMSYNLSELLSYGSQSTSKIILDFIGYQLSLCHDNLNSNDWGLLDNQIIPLDERYLVAGRDVG